MFWIILIVLGAIAACFVLAAGLIMPLFTGPTFNAPLDAFTVGFSQILFPVVLLIGLTGLFVGILQSYEHFTIPALAPAVWNLVIIVLLVVLRPALPRRLRKRRSGVRVRDRDPGGDRRADAAGRSARCGGSTSGCSSRSTGTTRASSRCSR